MSPRKTSKTALMRHVLIGAIALGLTAPASAGVGQYFSDRVSDFADIFRLRAGIPIGGKGYGVKARATALAQVGYVHFDGHYSGMDRRGIGTVREQRTEGGVSLLYFSNHRMSKVQGNGFLDTDSLWSQVEDRRLIRNLPYWDDGRRDLLSVGAEVATPILAIDFAVNPSEAVDFVAGIFTIDPFRDDVAGLERREEQRFIFPEDDPEPDTEAPVRELRERLDAEQSERDRRRMEESGQLGDYPDAEGYYPPAVEPAPVAPRTAPRSDRERVLEEQSDMNSQQLDAVDRMGEQIEYVAPNQATNEQENDEE